MRRAPEVIELGIVINQRIMSNGSKDKLHALHQAGNIRCMECSGVKMKSFFFYDGWGRWNMFRSIASYYHDVPNAKEL